MKELGGHEGCIEQMQRLFSNRLYPKEGAVPVDEMGLIRMDDWEMEPKIQDAVTKVWPLVSTENLEELTDFEGYQNEFLRLFGFGIKGVDYEADVDPVVDFE